MANHRGLRIGGLVLLTLAVVGSAIILPDLRRYIRLHNM